MREKIILAITSIISLYSCSQPPSISALCEKDRNGNYTLKWEVFPDRDDAFVEIFASANDSIFPSSPLLSIPANEYIAVLNKGDSLGYRYFKLKIGETTSDVITNRFLELDSVQNFRDIGGYKTNDQQMIRWGKIYRSGSFSRMTAHDEEVLNKLGLKTIVDLRPKLSHKKHAKTPNVANNIELPITSSPYDKVSKQILEGCFLKGDAVIYTQDLYRDIVENYSEAYAQLFDYMCDEDNYPLVYYCFLGKDQAGIATYFLLRALDIPLDVIEDDYMYSDVYINKAKLVKDADSLSEAGQEALTMVSKTDISYLKYAISCIRAKNGSVEEYMVKELRLTPEKREKLREILLY